MINRVASSTQSGGNGVIVAAPQKLGDREPTDPRDLTLWLANKWADHLDVVGLHEAAETMRELSRLARENA